MEIIFLIWIFLKEGQLNSVQYHNYYEYQSRNNLKDELRCSNYLQTEDLQRNLEEKLTEGEVVRVGCLSAGQIGNLEDLYNQSSNWKEISKFSTGLIESPETELGHIIVPEKQLMHSWNVYKNKIHLPIDTLNSENFPTTTPEGTVAKFFALMKEEKSIESTLSKKIDPKLKEEILINSKLLRKMSHLDLIANLPASVAKDSSSKGIFTADRDQKELEKRAGKFDVIVFVETPPLKEDSFVILAKEKKEYRIKAIFGTFNRVR
ncbi:MAG: hypothetical protein H7A24_03355 [Leptospiraceae bacterium]|nr:hypothetical protein [Leptospiraceae bacterium]MCP5510887.1 hypothetical protein [Leptospiraceae bacterium]